MTPKYLTLAIAALIATGATLPAAEQSTTLNTILDAGRDYGEYKAREKARKEREERRERDRDRQRRDNHYERHSCRNTPLWSCRTIWSAKRRVFQSLRK